MKWTSRADNTSKEKPPRLGRVGKKSKLTPRMLVGLALMGLSLTGVWWVVTETSTLRPYLVASAPIDAGQQVSQAAFDVVYLASPGVSFDYLTPDEVAALGGHVITQPVPAGALISTSLLAAAEPDDTTVFTTELTIGGAPWLVPGVTVDVWVAAPLENQAYSVPVVAAAGVVVSGVRADDGFAADASVVDVDLRVHYRDIAPLIHAQANNYSIQVSPASPQGGGGR